MKFGDFLWLYLNFWNNDFLVTNNHFISIIFHQKVIIKLIEFGDFTKIQIIFTEIK